MAFPENIIPDTYPTSFEPQEVTIISNASNLKFGTNSVYTIDNFIEMYPGFGPDAEGNYNIVPQVILQLYINLANASIQETRYGEYWQLCMGLFTAHFVTLWLEGTTQAGSPAAQVLEASIARGLRTSESVGDLSSGIDYSAISNDLDGWAMWKLTVFGQQFATMGKLVGKGGMMVW